MGGIEDYGDADRTFVQVVSDKTRALSAKDVEKRWLLVDAKGKLLGRLATQIAYCLRGKHKPSYTPHLDCGDHVVVVNAAQVQMSGKKFQQKSYIRHTGHPGGQRSTPAETVRRTHPERLIEFAVRGMLSKNILGRTHFRNLHVYADDTHPHEAQNPSPLKIK